MFGKKFAMGVNYLSSQNCINMWRDFDEKEIEKDFIALGKTGVKWVCLFPFWKEFQPVSENFADTADGVCEIMMDRLQTVLNLCKKHSLRVILTVFADFEDGTNGAPQLFADKNIYTNPGALMWEQRYIKYLVTRFKHHPALWGWCTDNFYKASSSIKGDTAAQESWTALVCNAIKVEDKEHPVISGQAFFGTESATPQKTQGWQIIPHSRYVDVLTSRHSAHNNMYEDIGGKPTFVNGAGYKDSDADFIRGELLDSYIHGCYAYFFKYPFTGNENNGLLDKDRNLTPLGKEANRIMTVISQTELPSYERQAVCVVPYNLRKASTFAENIMCLTGQNNIGVKYCFADENLPESKLYIVPALDGEKAVGKKCVERLLEKARRGASVYISVSGTGSEVFSHLGIKFIFPRNTTETLTFKIDDTDFSVNADYYCNPDTFCGRVLAEFNDGTPALISYPFGIGKIIISLFSAETKTAFDKMPYYKIYSLILKAAGVKPTFYTENPFVSAREHKINAKRSIVSLINISKEEQSYTACSAVGYQVKKTFYGELNGRLSKNEAVIFEIEKY
ncbi:MAG: hypothetical protein U0L72_02825 [Acutalibacteraceae bacterium]|nr:hypothetical protein [Acutalibacteraceae bacterium]